MRKYTDFGFVCAPARGARFFRRGAVRAAPSSRPNKKVLARANRITAQADFRLVARSGRRAAGKAVVMQCRRGRPGVEVRFGFVVSNSVGTAVVRNRVKRRLRAIARLEMVNELRGFEFVVRALPASADASWSSLQSEFSTVLARQMEMS